MREEGENPSEDRRHALSPAGDCWPQAEEKTWMETWMAMDAGQARIVNCVLEEV